MLILETVIILIHQYIICVNNVCKISDVDCHYCFKNILARQDKTYTH